MSHLYPSIPLHKGAFNSGEYAELELLQTLERGLSDAYSLFHSVDWSRGIGAQEQHGEIDIVIVNQAGDVLLIEVKSGDVDFTSEGIFKTYGTQVKNITRQIGLQYGALKSRLEDCGLHVHLSHLLVLPQLKVKTETAQWPRERIVDSEDIGSIVTRISQSLGPGLPNAANQPRVLAFFENKFQVVPDVSALTGRIQQSATRMSAGLATWVPRITCASGLLRVSGTAGSGKTQLALRMLRDADATGHKAAYICFNRALADHISQLAPVRMPAETFHEYAQRMVRRSGEVVDFKQAGAFDQIAGRCIELLEQAEPDLDLIILDEMQDMQPEWVMAMLSRLKTQGKAVLLEDPEQQLYKDRIAFDLPDAVSVTSHENFRTPRALVKLINLLRLTTEEVEAMSSFEGEMPDPIIYESPEKIAPCTVKAVERCLQRGFALSDMAVVSMRGRERSVLQGLDKLGPWSLNRFTGQFDENSVPIWKEGQLLIESVRRFKGQAAAAVVLTECDIGQLDPLNRRLLFVGLTRARVHLEWVISGDTARLLEETLGQ
jgi:hypothetical protein